MESLKSLINTNKGGDEVEARHQRCEEMREEAITKCPRVSFLVNIMEKMGCKMEPGFYSSVECEGQINGGFHLDEAGKPGVVLCQNHIPDQEWMDRTLAHELIHAFDHCRAKMDWNNCEQHACSEVRAAALSGDCNWKYEFFRKNFNVAGQHQICTRRRAKLSIQHNEACKGKLTSGHFDNRIGKNEDVMADVKMEEAVPAISVVSNEVAAVKADVNDQPAPETASGNGGEVVVHKKRKVERREKLRKTAICKHFDKPGGCPFPDCKFAHGRSEVKDGGMLTVAAQRKLIREQTISRAEDKFLNAKDASPASLRGTMASLHALFTVAIIERYYTELFSCDTMDRKMEDQYVHMHSNRLCVVGVAASHPVMQEEIEQIEFSTSVMESKVTGKKKKGGHFMVPTTILCNIKCKSGKTYALRSCIRGALIEVNERLIARPQLLQERALSDGYLVIIQPKLVEVAEIQESLLSKLEYQQFRSIVAAADEASTEAEPVKEESKTVTVEAEQEGDPANNATVALDQ